MSTLQELDHHAVKLILEQQHQFFVPGLRVQRRLELSV